MSTRIQGKECLSSLNYNVTVAVSNVNGTLAKRLRIVRTALASKPENNALSTKVRLATIASLTLY
jgi:hypothetical protein